MSLVQSPSFEIFKVSELDKMLNAEGRSRAVFDEQLQTNFSFIYFLKSGGVIMLPSDRNDNSKGILFFNKDYYLDCIKKDSFPLENPEMSTLEKYKTEIITINKGINGIIYNFCKKLDKTSEIKDFDISQIANLLLRIRDNIEFKKLNPKERLYAYLILGEYIRRINKGEWMVLKKYDKFNPYYEPVIVYPNSNFLLILNNAHSFFENKDLPLDAFLNWKEIKTPVNNIKNTYANKYIKL
jgi:hypothetical protein